MKNTILSLLLLILQTITALAQVDNQIARDNIQNMANGGMVQVMKSYNKIQGSPFLQEKWTKTTFLLSENRAMSDTVLAKFDIYANEVLYINSKKDSLWILKEKVSAFFFIEDSLKFKKVMANGKEDFLQYFNDSGKITLFVKHKKILSKGAQGIGYNSGEVFDEFTKMRNEFFVLKENKLKAIKPEADDIAKILEIDEKRLTEYIKKEKLKIKKTPDFQRLIDWLNTTL